MTETDTKTQTRSCILAGAGRAFRANGYGAAGVDALAKEAGVTSGAFYAYFKAEADAFRETLVCGMRELEQAVLDLEAADESGRRQRFIEFYVGERRTCAPTETCGLQSLSGEVACADQATRGAYEETLRTVIAAVTRGMPAGTPKERRDHRDFGALVRRRLAGTRCEIPPSRSKLLRRCAARCSPRAHENLVKSPLSSTRRSLRNYTCS
jgi:TetR/AcrR family transcriptional regulator, transcriptional repressor for nem operon